MPLTLIGRMKAAVFAPTRWPRFLRLFAFGFASWLVGAYLFVLLVDPYDVVPFSLPIERRIVSISYPFVYPQIARSRRFDSLVIGTSTSRLIDPEILNEGFNVRFANLAMNSMTAFEQKTMIEYFTRHSGPPKVLIVGIDVVWCFSDADTRKHNVANWPYWLYDDDPWNDYLYLLNVPTVEIAGRLVGNRFGRHPERVRYDGFEEFTPPDSKYDPTRGRQQIWGGRSAVTNAPPVRAEPPLAASAAAAAPGPPPDPAPATGVYRFPALDWLEEVTAKLPPSTVKVFAFMPVHVAAQPNPASEGGRFEAACKAQIAAIAAKVGASVIDYRIPSTITREDSNYWDNLHYRIGIARRLAREIPPAVLTGAPSPDASYTIMRR